MSRNSAAKKARRRKRQARAVDRTPAGVDPEHAEIAGAVGEINAWMLGRGWIFDEANASDDLVSWVYPPSAAEVDTAETEPDLEPVTRVWLALVEDDDGAVELEMGAVLVGAAAGSTGNYEVDPRVLPENVGLLEAYRLGEALPELG